MDRLALSNAYVPHDRFAAHLASPTVIGAPVPVEIGLGGRDAVRQYAKRLEADTNRLEDDAKAQIVFANPASLADIEKDYGTGSTEAVAVLQARAAKRGPEQTSKDIAWGSQFNSYATGLRAYSAQLQTFELTGPSVTEAWSQLQTWEKGLRAQYESFGKLGATKTTFTLPATYETATGEPDKESGLLTAAKWGAAALIALAIAKTVRG